MPNSYFKFKQFIVHQEHCAMKVTTDSCFFGAWAAEKIKNEELKIKNVLDIGTGTGLLSLMIAQKNTVEIDAVEIDEDAAGQAKENVLSSEWRDRINVWNENILSFDPQKKYDCIICNPPFYENELSSYRQTKNIAHHSEELTIAEVLEKIKIFLSADGIFFLMYPFKREKEVENSIKEKGLSVQKKVIVKQSVNHQPFRIICKGAHSIESSPEITTVSIWNEHQQYTSEFIELLKDYYLYL